MNASPQRQAPDEAVCSVCGLTGGSDVCCSGDSTAVLFSLLGDGTTPHAIMRLGEDYGDQQALRELTTPGIHPTWVRRHYRGNGITVHQSTDGR